MIISIIAAIAQNGVIGKDNRLVWHLPADMRFFKKTTMGHTLIMGRKTFESFGKPLPGRKSIVVTRQKHYKHQDISVAHSFSQALALCSEEEEIFVIGGAEIYIQALPMAKRLYLTFIHHAFNGDTLFPPIDLNEWVLLKEEHHPADEKNEFSMSFRLYERI